MKKIKNKYKIIIISIIMTITLLILSYINISATSFTIYNTKSYSYLYLYYIDEITIENLEYDVSNSDYVMIRFKLSSQTSSNVRIDAYSYKNNSASVLVTGNLIPQFYYRYSNSNAYYEYKDTSQNLTSRDNLNDLTIENNYLCLKFSLYGNQTYRNTFYNYFTYNQITTHPLTKSYNTGNFINNSQNFDEIIINGQSSDNSTFDSVESIKYNNTIVYQNNSWVSGYSSTLGYTYEMNVPSLSTINSDQNIITFNTQLVQDTFQQIYNIEFINGNNVSYDTITINGTTLNGTTFNTINNIYYDLTQVYASGYFISPYTSVLNYIYTMNQPNVTAINTACNNIITFTTNLLAVNYDNTYNIGYFINNDGYFDSVRIVGTTLNGTTYNSISYMKYNDTFVYNNNDWLNEYNGLLNYNYGATPPDIITLNQVQNVIIFSSQMISLEQTVLDKMTASYNGIIDIVQQTANTITSGQIVLTIMCVALPLTMFIGSIFIKIFKSRKGKA